MALYTPGPDHGLPSPPGYTSTGVGFSDGVGSVGASENATPRKGTVTGFNLGQFFALREMFHCPGFKPTLSALTLNSLYNP